MGKRVTVEITNDDSEAHDLAIESLELNTGTIEAGRMATVTFTVPEGPMRFVCTYHDDMSGSIIGI